MEAAEHLASALETPNDPSIVKYRQMLADALTMARAQIGELAIQAHPPGAEVVVNGRPAGVLPLSSAIKLPARNAEVVVRAPGHSERRELVPIAGGQRHELTVNLEKIEKPAEQPSVITVTSPPPSPTPAPSPSAPASVEHRSADPDASGSSLRTAAWVFGGGALVAAGAGLALNLAARSNRSEFDASCNTLPTIMADPETGGHLTTAECQESARRLGDLPALEHCRLRHRRRPRHHLDRPLPELTPDIHDHACPHAFPMRPQPERNLMPRHLLITAARTVFVLAMVTGCYGTPRSVLHDSGASGGNTGGEGPGGAGGPTSTGGAGTGPAGTGGAAGTGGTATGIAGTSAGGSAGSSNPVFVGGPCVTTPDGTTIEVFAKGSDGRIFRRAYDGSNWNSWANLAALDGSLIDARSDLDCDASGTTVHLVAAGVNPIGGLLHAFGSDTIYNPFFRELASFSFAPGPSIAAVTDSHYFLGALGIGAITPALYEFGETSSPRALTPITTEAVSIRSGPDIAFQTFGASAVTHFVAFDMSGNLVVYFHVLNSGGAHWEEPVNISPPLGTFTFSPTVCTENGSFGVTSINLVASAGGQLWYSQSPSITSAFSSWAPIASAPASSPDCTVTGAQSIVHVVATSTAGTVLDINGKGTAWVVTDLRRPALTRLSGQILGQPALLQEVRAGDLLGDDVRVVGDPEPVDEPVTASEQVGPTRAEDLHALVPDAGLLGVDVAAAVGEEPAVLRAEIGHTPLSRTAIELTDAAARDEEVELILGDSSVVDDLNNHHLAVQRVVDIVVAGSGELELVAAAARIIPARRSHETVREVRANLKRRAVPAHIRGAAALARVPVGVRRERLVLFAAALDRRPAAGVAGPAARGLAAVPVT